MKRALLILLAVCLAACSGEEITPEVLVVEGWIEEGRAPVVYLTTSLVPKEEPESFSDLGSHIVKWAKVTISDGDEEVILTGTASKRFYPPYAYTTGKMTGTAGKTYRLTVEYGGVKAEASARVLSAKALSALPEPVRHENGTYSIRACFEDDPATEDYYRFFHKVEKVDSVFIPSPFCFMADDVNEAIILPGHSISRSADDTAGFQLFSGFNSGDRVQVKFCTMEREMYNFWKAFEEQTHLANVPLFTIDGNLPGNVTGDRAIGYFAGYGSTVYNLVIP